MATLAKILIVLYSLASLTFFSPLGVELDEIAKLISYGSMMLLFALSAISHNKVRPQKQFAVPARALMVFIGISTIMPMFTYVDQSFSQTVIATLPFFSYGLYLAIREFDIDAKFFYGLIFSIAALATIAHIVNHITYPIITFGKVEEEYDLTRGGLRINVIGFSYVILAFFTAINQWRKSKKLLWWIPIILLYAVILSSYTRQHIVACFIIGVWCMLGQIGFIKKSIIVVIVGITLLVVIPQIPAFDDMVELTIEQYEENEYSTKDNVRIAASRFYGWEGYNSLANHLFGHGVPSFHSKWGQWFKSFNEMEQVYAYDVGWFGMMWFFGIFTALSLLTICLMAIFRSGKHSTSGLNAYFIWLAVTGFTCGAVLYPYEIFVTVIAMCLLDSGRTIQRQIQQRTAEIEWGDTFNWRRIRQTNK